MLKVDTIAPPLNLNSTNGSTYSLKDSIGKYIVLYFYPKMTHLAVQLRLIILINYYLNLKN